MVKEKGVIAIDTNVFVIDLRYRRDRNFGINRRFLRRVHEQGGGVTSLVNLLEIVGILSFNLNERQLREFSLYFPEKYNVHVIPAPSAGARLPEFETSRLMEIMGKKASFGDALVAASIESFISHASCFVTWDSGHFDGKVGMPVMSPAEYLSRKPGQALTERKNGS